MEHTVNRTGFVFMVLCCLLFLSVTRSVDAYKNYTVGDSKGWFDNTEKAVDYQKWADAKNLSLGDFLIFQTDTNHSVVQTYNLTTYKLCDYNDADDHDTIEWSTSNPSNTATTSVAVAVPLLKEGMTYFFSGNYDGDQCKNGQHFKINVSHGQGLPPSLREPSDDDAPAPNSPDFGGDETAPDTIVPANFYHPLEESDTSADDSASVSLRMSLFDSKISRILVLIGILFVSFY